ncbi:NERD domain-containing protein [Burkholderia pseudomallei]|uniref:NERD domain-containing protein n=3 Tax=Burkholderia pseudomallei TaxID=28450 RepID=UPI0004225DBA|nr:NERD domain-containing protein [Burkholderia pseudomallei]AIP52119.1 phoH-like family protein [Burkholderia pseudomallei HBPUB10134a]MBF3754671.1 NERD domain-containing protein [Burkholderia pseudomallei]MBO7797164.1 NERD domain-containing protein [Burkholderia pseudomallei]MBO7815347.1 NERD domain-containing protein [Burkholderia pseudomallei]MVZ84221.1 AAA family ATPase [Burkholderia pseudomallei]
MAKYIGLGTDDPVEDSEKRVAAALQRLSDDWTVLHHVSWQSKRGGRQGDGEADFVLVHPRKGILVLEVKGGGIEIETGRWFTTDRNGRRFAIKNPFEQAVASKHALVGWLSDHGLGTKARIGHAVVFPHMEKLPLIGPAGTEEVSLTKRELDNVERSLARCVEHWQLASNMSPTEVEKVVSLLAPTVSISPKLSGKSTDAEAELIVLTAEQVDVFAGLRANRGGLIVGGAGTGKTVLAVTRAQQLTKDGFRTLLVCYNELLGRDLSVRVADTRALTACTFHTLCLQEARRAKLRIPTARSRDWWEKGAPELLIEACAINRTSYDAIVVDEGQDFSPLWLDSLRCLTVAQQDAALFIFADPLQDIWKRDWQQGFHGEFVWELTRNMRNTQPIAVRVAAAVKMTSPVRGIQGPPPIWQVCDDEPRESEVIAAIELLLDEGFSPSNIVVLCGSTTLVTRLRERSVAGVSLGQWGTHGIVTETISRFKGLESQAVILVLSSVSLADDRVGAYVGMSRARSMLVVIGTHIDREYLNWLPMPK